MRKVSLVIAALVVMTMTAQGSTLVNNGEMTINGSMLIDWDVTGSGTFTGDGTATFAGTLRPGNSPGTTTLDIDTVLALSNTLVIEVAGIDTPGVDYDYLHLLADNTLTLGGTLAVDFYDGFSESDLSAGDTFDIISADAGATITGTFDALDFSLAPTTGLFWEIYYNESTVSLGVVERQPNLQDFSPEQGPNSGPIPEPATAFF